MSVTIDKDQVKFYQDVQKVSKKLKGEKNVHRDARNIEICFASTIFLHECQHLQQIFTFNKYHNKSSW